jgi:hypothetical protein
MLPGFPVASAVHLTERSSVPALETFLADTAAIKQQDWRNLPVVVSMLASPDGRRARRDCSKNRILPARAAIPTVVYDQCSKLCRAEMSPPRVRFKERPPDP